MSSIKKKIMEINTINLVGRAGREPDVRYFESGSIVANFTLGKCLPGKLFARLCGNGSNFATLR